MNVFNKLGQAVAGAFDQVLGIEHGKLWLQLQQPSYVGGDIVAGTVYLQVHQPFQARGVYVNIYGYEMAKFETTHTQRSDVEGEPDKVIVSLHEETREFFRERINVWSVGGMIGVGNYNFPFQYKLPDNLPGVFEIHEGKWGKGDAYRAEILYIAEAKFDVAFSCNLYDSNRLIVNEKFDRALKPSFSQDSKTFMFTAGRLTAKMWLDHNCYFPGNSIVAKLEANNTSVKPTKSISLSLHQTITLKAHKKSRTVHRTLSKSSVKGFEPSFYGVRFVPFRVPLDALPTSTSGRLVRNTYAFDLTIQIPKATNLHVVSKTAILAPQFLFSNAPPEAPPLASVPAEVSFRPPWQPDDQAPKCTRCAAGFNLFKRRHHCRHCAKVFCNNCCDKKTKITNLGYDEAAVRVCEDCYPVAKDGGKQYATAHEFVSQIVEPTWAAPAASAPPVMGVDTAPVMSLGAPAVSSSSSTAMTMGQDPAQQAALQQQQMAMQQQQMQQQAAMQQQSAAQQQAAMQQQQQQLAAQQQAAQQQMAQQQQLAAQQQQLDAQQQQMSGHQQQQLTTAQQQAHELVMQQAKLNQQAATSQQDQVAQQQAMLQQQAAMQQQQQQIAMQQQQQAAMQQQPHGVGASADQVAQQQALLQQQAAMQQQQ